MSKTNCVNCGAAIDTSEIKCPFCGTTYLDLTAIDFSSGKPVVCEFVLPNTFKFSNMPGKVVMSMLAVPRLETVEMTSDTMNVYGGFEKSPIASFKTELNINVDVTFKPVARNNNKEVFTLRALEA